MPGDKSGTARKLLTEYRGKRDFKKTREPSGEKSAARRKGTLRFVIQKHAASHLHFDLRLELDGVMKSWAVPKGPSLDPAVKRLAMQVEDHPIDYNTFEGTIPQGEYGGGTVMLWDKGTYSPDKALPREDPETAVREGLRNGDLKISFDGERLHGSFALVRMKFGDRSSGKPQWLLIKHRDGYAAESDVVADNLTSVTTGRTMEEIAEGRSRVWRSNRAAKKQAATAVASRRPASRKSVASRKAAKPLPSPQTTPKSLEPMYASVGTDLPAGDWTFEPKYDGIRILAFVTPDEVRLITRNGKDKAAQFPEIVEALEKIARRTRRSLVLDGEMIALVRGKPARFQELQGRMHVKETSVIEKHSTSAPAALVLFDMLMDGEDVLIREPWTSRRESLVKRIGKHAGDRVRITDSSPHRGAETLAKAHHEGWEGVIAKKMDARYEPGNRSKSWLKLKIEFRQEFVVGGFTEPRNTREHIGALLLGYYDGDRFIYVGHTGGGFTHAGLAEMYKTLHPLEQKTSPFAETPRTNERAHWVKPRVVVEVKFSEWTADRRLRQPIYLGVRDDKKARDVGRESTSVQRKTVKKKPAARKSAAARRVKKTSAVKKTAGKATRRASAGGKRSVSVAGSISAQLDEIESSGGDGTLGFAKGVTLKVSNLSKIYFPKERISKGDLMRYYADVAEFILPTVTDRPLVLKRFPGGIEGPSFYQQRAGDNVPHGVRVQTIVNDEGEKQDRFIGGDLPTLLYTIQLGAISVDPWHSRVGTLGFADYTVVDLDPGPRANFARVVQVARWCKEIIDEYGLNAGVKTSGSTGLHIYIPLPPKTPTEAATLVAQFIAAKVAEEHPREATIERMVKSRGAAMVYVDFLQNIKGKTIAGAYCVRAKPGAPISTPLLWDELDDDLDPKDFTIRSVPDRFREVGDVWSREMKKKNSLKRLLER
ncbi:MAG: DNA ligase D [Gemmatimonadota bacterium]|nr:DNA ligase D [Gemmatimonadota bacterium]